MKADDAYTPFGRPVRKDEGEILQGNSHTMVGAKIEINLSYRLKTRKSHQLGYCEISRK